MYTCAIMAVSILPCVCNATDKNRFLAPTKGDSQPIIRGVNLGGWLVLEPWITPQLFENANEGVPRGSRNSFTVVDEFTWRDEKPGDHNRSDLLLSHWKSWVNRSILEELKNAGITHLRIPVGYWYFKSFDDEPFAKDVAMYPVALGLLKTLTNEWAKNLNLKVLIDLHTAPGSQNGFDNSGRRGPIRLLDDNNLERWHLAIEALAHWCADNLDSDTLFGIEVLNEPAGFSGSIFQNVKDFINPKGYQSVRNDSKEANVVFQTAFEGPSDQAPYVKPEYRDCWFDEHSYQCFGAAWNVMATQSDGWGKHLDASCREGFGDHARFKEWSLWTFAGEFSLAVTDCTLYLAGGMNGGCERSSDPNCKYQGWLDQNGHSDTCKYYNKGADELPDDYKQFLGNFARAQMDAFEVADGWFFWNFRTENGHAPEWDYLLGLREGWMPKDAGAREPFCQSFLREGNVSRSITPEICHGRSVCD